MSEESINHTGDEEIVSDKGESKLSDLWKSEDYVAIWLGLLLLILSLIFFLPQGDDTVKKQIADLNITLQTESEKAGFKTIEWYEALDKKKSIKASKSEIGKTMKQYTSKPNKWTNNPTEAFYASEEVIKSKIAAQQNAFNKAESEFQLSLDKAKEAQSIAENADFKNTHLNQNAIDAIKVWRAKLNAFNKIKSKSEIKPYNKIPNYILLMTVLALIFGIARGIMGFSIKRFFAGFVIVFIVALLSFLFEQNATMRHYGIGYAAWAIAFGLIISNTVGTPKWVLPAVQTEFYIKTGLVLLGAEILFGKILTIGIPGIFVAWVVTPIVLITTFWFGQKIVKIHSKTLNITISADMSVCGVSAAIATAAACRAKKEELTLAVGMSLIFTSIMMILMPAIINAIGIPHILGGAWIGGTIDATGAVAAAGAFLSDRALYVAATIKMIQNVLIGIIAFCVALYWVTKIDRKKGQKISAAEIWYRFPKFVLGFIAASIVFSIIYQALGKDMAYVVIDQGSIRGMTKILRGWFFCLAFVSIGLAADFRELKKYFKGGKPLILYICGQSFNLILTLIMAYLMFYIIFREITGSI